MSLSPEDSARLATLKAARDKLLTGQNVVRAQYNGFDTQFGPGDLERIEGEIEKLERLAAGKPNKRRGAFGFRL